MRFVSGLKLTQCRKPEPQGGSQGAQLFLVRPRKKPHKAASRGHLRPGLSGNLSAGQSACCAAMRRSSFSISRATTAVSAKSENTPSMPSL